MSVLLFAPGLLLLLLEAHGIAGAIAHIAICAFVQFGLGLPFLLANPLGYLLRAFGGFGDLNQKWSVNWKFLPAALFQSKLFPLLLLSLHLGGLAALVRFRWGGRDEGGVLRALRRAPLKSRTLRRRLRPEHVLTVLLGSMAIGVVFARSLHFQFYCWYWHSLPWLFWRCERLPLALKAMAFALLEFAWSYGVEKTGGTPTALSAAALQAAHLVLLSAIWLAPPTTAHECVAISSPEHLHDSALATCLFELNHMHASEVETLAIQRGGVSPADARGAVLVAANASNGDLEVQLWEGKVVTIVTEGSAQASSDGLISRVRRLVKERQE